MSDEPKYILKGIQIQLRGGWNRLIAERISVGVVMLILVVASWLLLLLMVEMRLWIPTLWRSILFWVWTSASLLLLGWLVVWPWLFGWIHRSKYQQIARIVTNGKPSLQNRIICLLELCSGKSSASPQPLIDQAVKTLDQEVSQMSLTHQVNWMRILSWSRFLVIPVGLLVILVLAAPQGLQHASVRLFSPGTTFERPTPFSLVLSPGDTQVIKGDSISVIAEAFGAQLPEIVTFQLGTVAETSVRSNQVGADSLGQFVHHENNIRFPLRYRAVAGSVSSPWYKITIVDRPVLRNLQISLDPPAYTGLSTEQLPSGTGHITALQGTQATITINSSMADVHAWLSIDADSNDVIFEESSATIEIHDETTYQILLESRSGVRNLDPITYSITPIVDRYPSVEIISPSASTDMDFELLIPLTIRVQDDFGFSRFTLSWRLSESRFGDTMESYDVLNLPIPSTLEVQYLWDLDATTQLDIVPGDVISYYVTIWDNDGYNGAKKRVSTTQTLRLPSITERYEALESIQENTESNLESLIEDAQQVRDQFDELRDEVRRKQDSSWDDRQNLEALRQTQEMLQNRVDELAQNMAEAAEQMDDHELVSDELLDLFDEIQNVTQEINSPELLEALQELQEAMSDLDPAGMQESLEKFEFNEEMFRERMERTLELFKNFQIQQQLEEAAKRAEDLKNVQDNLAEQTAQDSMMTDPDESLSMQQEQASQEMMSLEEKMQDIAERMSDLKNVPTSQMQQLNQQTASQELPEQMQMNAQQMQSGQMQQANQGQQQMSQAMSQLQSDLSDIQSGMTGQQMSINTAALKQVLSNTLRLSIDQEQLRAEIRDATHESPLLRGFARRQSILATGGALISDSLQSLARHLPQLPRDAQRYAGNALLNMNASVEELTDRDPISAESHGGQSMTSLNDLAFLLSELLEQLMNSSSSSGGGGMSMENMIQQLQQMAQQQDQLNKAMAELFGQPSGERLSPDMQERLNQIAAQQEAMRRQLTDLAQQRDLANRLAGDLERIAQQMEETVRDLQSGQVNRPTRQRQQQILTRLLDASRSLQERGRERRRESQQASEIDRQPPPPLRENMSIDQLQRALIDALESGYTRDYQRLIQRYFELLERQ